MLKKTVFVFVNLLLLLCSFNLKAANSYFDNDKLSLQLSFNEGSKFLACFTLKDGWHISYQNPGDAGVPTSFGFEGVNARLLNQSVPQTFLYQDILTQYAYENFGCYLFELSNITNAAKVHISWTACQDYCEPEETQIAFKDITERPDENLYQKAFKTFPLSLDKKVFALKKGDTLILTTDFKLDEDAYFVPKENVFNADAEQILTFSKNKSVLKIITDGFEDLPREGLFVFKDRAYEFDILPQKPNLFWILLTAFLAGILLNLMPCVFPVLSLKAIQMVNDTRLKKGRFLKALFYVFGVVLSFLSIAGVLYLLKSTGAALGWGFQLQSPIFVGLMLILFVVIFLQSLEIVHFRLPFGAKIHKVSGLNSFMTGFFAVLIASPCTGPFMGAALGYALFESAEIYFPVFLALSLGYALPFAMLEMFPFVMKKIMPKPGKWMKRIKYVLSLPIALTVLWLGWVLSHQILEKKEADIWLDYDENELFQSLEKGEAVFIDFTAKWCLTCLLNEQTVLNSSEFIDFAKQNNIKLIKADWTNKNEKVFKALKKYKRSSIPLYVYYPAYSSEYIILPTLLTTDSLLSVLDDQNQDDN